MNTLLDALIEQGMYVRKFSGKAEPRISIPTGEILNDNKTFELNGHKYIYKYDADLDENNE